MNKRITYGKLPHEIVMVRRINAAADGAAALVDLVNGGSKQDKLRVGLEGSHLTCQPFGSGQIVCIHSGNKLGAGVASSVLKRGGNPLRGLLKQNKIWMLPTRRLGDHHRIVSRTVIDDDKLESRMAGAQKA